MRKITIAEAQKSLGHYLKLAASGEEIAIESGADLISLRKLEVAPVDPTEMTDASGEGPLNEEDWPEFPTFQSGPEDGAINHDNYLYDEPRNLRRTPSR